ncbi:DUF1778 domain-containing protein [Aeromonas hydrophila]|uniref:type II toxin-antitoxin system TacA family antitoxin n=1 Tax=Aeromonas hydrophila TaxID=644 RepID=UPI000332B4EE|nr:DUF1778 domain-containing protein [Aeromonas hydrophila]AGM42781.1 hypothetical protein AHML_04985 [Aeromonas hydrophila ML09-119]AJE37671.1 CopG family transcriptional regulator [Aeromonas hydrophila J-1]ALQ64760.1 hypothetical protein AS145_18325 [Aeromonas hydrophila]ALZ81433.1 hypothetical protein AhyD4_18145 [Aeromonas hydrophila]EGX6959754.1 DUF1778 domain-containing protein [Aeromonas hydrophila]
MSIEQPKPAETTLAIRLPECELLSFERAAELRGISVTSFVLEACHRLAEATIIDRSVLVTEKPAYTSFLDALGNSPTTSEPLNRTLTAKSPWDL